MSIDYSGNDYFFPRDIAQLLTNNSTPSDNQLHETKTILNQCLTSLNTLDNEIQRQKAILEGLYAQRTQKQQHVTSCSFILSPIRRVPSELLAEIFIHTLPCRGKMSYREAPLLLCRVCRTWRDVAMSEPRLWQDLEIKAVSSQGFVPRRGKQYALAAAEWFRRARSLPLSFHLSFHASRVLSGFTPEEVEDSRPFFYTFAQESDGFLGQVANLELGGGEFGIITSYLPSHGAMNRYKNLESLILNFQGYNEPINPVDGVEYFRASKQLKRLVIGQSYGGWKHSLPEFMFPWNQLTQLCIYNRCMTPYTFMDVLSECVNLKEAVVHLAEGIPPPPVGVAATRSNGTIALSYLSNLTVQFSDSGNQHIFSKVELPSLQSLDISSILKQGMRALESSRLQFKAAQWAPFYKHLFPLRKLSFIKSCLVTVPDVLAMLSAAPNVTHLHLTISECSSSGKELVELFNALIAGGDEGSGDEMLLPQLEEMNIEFRRLSMFSGYGSDERGGKFLRRLGEVITEVVGSRCPAPEESETLDSNPALDSMEVYGLRRVKLHSQEEEWKPLMQGVLSELVGRWEVIRQCTLEFSAGSHKIGCSPLRVKG